MPEKGNGTFSAIDYTKPSFDFDFKQNYKVMTEYDFVEPSEKMSSDIEAVKKNFYNSFYEPADIDTISKYVTTIEKCVKPLVYKDFSNV